MALITTCPNCKQSLAVEQSINGLAYCPSCSWSGKEHSILPEKSQNRKLQVILLTMAIVAVGSFIFASKWGSYAGEFASLKVKHWTGSASKENLSRIAEICQIRKSPRCMESALNDLALLAPQKAASWEKLATAQFKHQNYSGAMDSFRNYFKLKGKKYDMALMFAETLAAGGHINQAVGYYKYVMGARQYKDKAKAAHSYVSTLMKAKRYRSARKVILSYRQTSPMAAMFAKKELQIIRKHIGGRGIAAISKKSKRL